MRVTRAWTPITKAKGFRPATVKAATEIFGVPIAACVAHRCPAHEDVKPLNLNTPEKTECAACVGADLKSLLDLYTDLRDRLERACGALNLLSPGAGDPFLPPPIEEVDERPEAAGTTDQADTQPDEASAVQADPRRKT